ncbi:hypothetical protein [Cupriavidus sp. TMH.W2]|uniref:hypothetical protein n=1 Tax=Cupriavidus sp. TMH.W2 TaxID=3434465 RepID=UPI003D771D9D
MAKKLTLGSLNDVGGDDARTDELLARDDAAGEQAHRGQPVRRREQAAPATEAQADATATPQGDAPAIENAQSAGDLIAALAATEAAKTPEEEEAAKLAAASSAGQLSELLGDAPAPPAGPAEAITETPAVTVPNAFSSAVKAKSATAAGAKAAATRGAAPDPAAQYDSMSSVMQDANLLSRMNPVTPGRRASGRDKVADTGATAPQLEDAENAKPARQQAMVSGPAATGAGAVGAELLGRAIATPFLALSSAYRHLKGTGKQLGLNAENVPAPANRTEADFTLPAAPHISGQRITSWKLGRIEASQNRVIDAADALRGTDEYMVWEEKLQSIAHDRKMPIEQIVQTMTTDPDLFPLKEGMDAIWEKHPTLVGAYQDACNGFCNHLEDVTKVFASSPDDVRERVSAAMAKVVENTTNLPGFGDDLGEYRRTIAERVREKLEAMMKFLSRVLERVAGVSKSGSELTP